MKKFAFCKCFYEQNIFIKSWNCHVTFKNDQKFREEYQTSSGLEEALIEAKVEVERRINSRESWKARRDKIEQNYSPILSEKLTHFIQDFDNSTIFEDGFKAGVHWASDRTTGSTIPTSINKVGTDVFTLPVFKSDFCSNFLKELQNFKNSDLPHQRPNSMNRQGILLDDLPFLDDFLKDFRKTLEPLFIKLFPQFMSGDKFCLDSHKAFVVHYSCDDGADSDVDLASHFDNSEVTINISLSAGHEGGELVFQNAAGHTQFGVDHEVGVGVLHLGSHHHLALPITSGERWNLILWLRSSDIRNRICPMCGLEPDKIVAPFGSYGDGFTLSETELSSSLCSCM